LCQPEVRRKTLLRKEGNEFLFQENMKIIFIIQVGPNWSVMLVTANLPRCPYRIEKEEDMLCDFFMSCLIWSQKVSFSEINKERAKETSAVGVGIVSVMADLFRL
jgi:hypothetical protein